MERILSPRAVEDLLTWYEANKRDLPWRHTKDPYRIWISEIMLQQTRVEAVKQYYARFLEAFPSVEALANASEERLMKLWEGLGYYSRARNLQRAAREVMEQYGGEMPADERALRSLCGIGDYTAGAIASIAFGIPAPAVDGNVLRVLSRVCGSEEDISKQTTRKRWSDALREVIPQNAPAAFTQAMIELGATVCGPNCAPRCEECPFLKDCVAAREGRAEQLPVKSAKKERRVESLTVLLIRDGDRTALRKRPAKGLLAGLYELPNLRGHVEEAELPSRIRELGFEPLRIVRIEDAKHIFTHVEWHMIAYDVRITPEFDGIHEPSGLLLVGNEDLKKNYAVPSAFAAYKRYLF